MKIQPSLFFLALLSAIPLCQSAVLDDRFEKFKNQHINTDMDRGCDDIIQSRNILDTNFKCKTINTFILHPVENVTPVCQNGTPICGNLMKSEGIFDTVVCKLKGNINDRPCRYDSSNKRQHIVIACDGGKPVHLEDSRRS
ncbi:ribonuclease-like [Poecilia reticulata]|uniref:ribonuclease-like n=1 Tax=Poecilia reticulata TaxID=8081 RepID=UPI0004A29495|nr:PREDICTED: ribonuclease-like [Poecilia reticulata]